MWSVANKGHTFKSIYKEVIVMDIGVHTKTHVVSIVTPTETIHHCVASHKIAEAYATQVAMYKQEDDTVYIRRYC